MAETDDMNPFASPAASTGTASRRSDGAGVVILSASWLMMLVSYVPAIVVPPGGLTSPFDLAIPKGLSTLITATLIGLAFRYVRGGLMVIAIPVCLLVLFFQAIVVSVGLVVWP